jgi:hypothetical protein
LEAAHLIIQKKRPAGRTRLCLCRFCGYAGFAPLGTVACCGTAFFVGLGVAALLDGAAVSGDETVFAAGAELAAAGAFAGAFAGALAAVAVFICARFLLF